MDILINTKATGDDIDLQNKRTQIGNRGQHVKKRKKKLKEIKINKWRA